MGLFNNLFGKRPPAETVPPIQDPVFGSLRWDSQTQCWEGSYPAPRGESFMLLVTPRSDTDRGITDEARLSFIRVAADFETLRQRTADDFLPEFNHDWCPENPITREQLLSNLHPCAINIDPDGSLSVEFANDRENDILGGHAVVCRFCPNGTYQVGLEG